MQFPLSPVFEQQFVRRDDGTVDRVLTEEVTTIMDEGGEEIAHRGCGCCGYNLTSDNAKALIFYANVGAAFLARRPEVERLLARHAFLEVDTETVRALVALVQRAAPEPQRLIPGEEEE